MLKDFQSNARPVTRRCIVSTLNEIAMNHARMAREKAQESAGPSERHLQIVGFEIPPVDAQQHAPLHLVAAAQDGHHVLATGYSL
jgi:hypothetical protein